MSKHFHQFPALQAGQRMGFNDAHLIADLGDFLFVVSIEFLTVLYDFLELRVRNASGVNHNDGLGHLVGGHNAHTCLADTLGFLFSIVAHQNEEVDQLGVRFGLSRGAFALNGESASQILADLFDALIVFKLASGLLESEIEGFFLEVADKSRQLLIREGSEIFRRVLGHNVSKWYEVKLAREHV